MDESKWNIEEVKRLKKKQLVEFNIGMLVIFVLSLLYIKAAWPLSTVFALICVLLWFFSVHALYILLTEKTTGTKTNQLVQAFDRDHWGKKRWKRKKITEVIILSVVSIMFTVFVFTVDTGSEMLQFYNLLPFIGAWIGSNLGNIVRISNLD
ncbi:MULTISPECIES: hypothetical protein [Sporosarcina]|uniref:hypothetical protein n=1 Tax=Sporosarcina TaxID=1569 RepID=UPI000A17E3BA|nr:MULTISPECIES: hypothetical protein [Sporosarcina]ARK20303.1 hypothetical protein SporoP32a_01305 [Sporosarcina ureae]PIC73930.1 hypothetical protein CSV76_08450 [Sporosarcina sp. P17b]